MSSRIWLMFIAHLVAGIAFSVWSAVEEEVPFVLEYILVVPPFALIFCQSCLLAFWATMSHAAVWTRLAGLIAGTIYLEILLCLANGEDDLVFMVTIATGVVAVVLLIIRLWRAQLHRFVDRSQPGGAEGLQFSIKGLMLFTLAVALFITAVKGLREVSDSLPDQILIALWALCFVVMDLAAAWAALGLASPVARSIVVLVMSLALGWFFCYAITEEWETYFYIMSIMFLQSLCLIGSFLVLRSCGYRMIRHQAVSS